MAVKKMNINVVHYSKLIDRKKNLINEFKNYQINLIFNEKYNKENLNRADLKRFNYRYIDKFIKRKPGFRKLKKSMISAFMKHIDLLTSQDEDNSYIVIIEDDLILEKDFENRLNKVISNLPQDFGFCFFDSFRDDYGKVEDRLFDPKKIIHEIDYFEPPDYSRSSNKRCGKTRGAGGYIFNLRYRQLLKDEYYSQEKIYIMIDHWLNHFINQYDLRVFWVEPALSRQGSQNAMMDRSF